GAGLLQRVRNNPSGIGSMVGTFTRYQDLGVSDVRARYFGLIAELRQWNVVLTTAEREAIEAQLYTTYGISVQSLNPSQSLRAKSSAEEEVPDDVEVVALYPNPVRDAATLRVRVDEESEVRVSVYDALGRQVATLNQGTLPAGQHEVRLARQSLSAGVYLVRVEVGGTVHTRRLTFLR
ncbi:MAG: T9SS type A sorting domain-containing protein, partial [Bacteroidota bacterium]